MSLPVILIPDGYDKTMMEIRMRLEERVTNGTKRMFATPSFHRGTPDPQALPDEQLGVWLTWDAIDPDEDETNGATFLASTWHLYIVTKTDDNDSFGGDSDLGLQVFGSVLTTLTESNIDLSLDGACDVIPVPRTRHFKGTLSGGDRRVDVIETILIARHEPELIRRPIDG